MGKESTGYNVPFDPALAIIAAIIVEEIAIPKFPKIKVIKKSKKFLITNSEKRAEYRMVMTIFIRNTKIKLNSSFPVNTVEGEAINCKVRDVPLSSSLTKARERPDMAEKNITTQKSPPVSSGEIFSLPIEKRITLIATTINIARELIA